MSMNGVESQLQAHFAIGINVGITEPQLQQAISIIEKKIGANEAGVAKEVLTKVKAARAKNSN